MLFLQVTKSPQALPNETTRIHNDLIPSHSPSEFPRPIPKAKMQPPLQVFYLGANRPIICKVYGRTSMCVKLNRDIISRMEVRSSTSWPVSTCVLQCRSRYELFSEPLAVVILVHPPDAASIPRIRRSDCRDIRAGARVQTIWLWS